MRFTADGKNIELKEGTEGLLRQEAKSFDFGCRGRLKRHVSPWRTYERQKFFGSSFQKRTACFLADRHAVTALEYGIVAAFLCLSLLGIFSGFGSVVSSMFSKASSGI